MASHPPITLYNKPGCPWCVDAIAYLKRLGFAFEIVDVNADREAFREMKELSGQTCAPTMTVGDLLLADFDTDELQAFLDEHEIRA